MRRPRIAGGNARGHGNRFTPAAGRGGTERRRQGLYGDRRRWVSDRAARLSPCEENCAAAQPAMLFAHGGGWCLGSLALYDRPCQALANATGRVILSVDYRLAPEYPFPQPLEDVYQALCWVAQQAPQLRIDAQRGGGRRQRRGNLAAAVALLARDRGGPHIERQLLLYPALSREMATTSYREFAEGHFLTRDAMVFCWQQYLAQRRDPAPSRCTPPRCAGYRRPPS